MIGRPIITLTIFLSVMLALFLVIRGDGSPKCCLYHVNEYNKTNNSQVVKTNNMTDKELLDLMLLINSTNNVIFF
jgi:hypothetical protein